MTYTELFALRDGAKWLPQFVVATERAAAAIMAEPPATTNHAARVAWASKALFDPMKSRGYASMMMRFALAVDETMQAGGVLTDEQVQAMVTSYVPAVVASAV